ncbi:MAG TPA: GGDEF domain-containing protein [Thermoanaerobaculia bacterium]
MSRDMRDGGEGERAGAVDAAIEGRTRLRTRILLFSAAWGVLLIAVAFLLTWRARESQKELGRVVEVDLRATAQLEQIARNQNAFTARWLELARAGSPELESFGRRYASVRDLAAAKAVKSFDIGSVPMLVAEFDEVARAATSEWPAATPARRDAIERELRARSDGISAAAFESMRDIRKGADRKLAAVNARADGLMLTALGVTWMIAIVTLALARLALAKIVAPLERLSATAGAIARDPSHARRAPISGDREVAMLALDFNRMVDAVAARDAKLTELSETDELTQMYNFRAFDQRVREELERAGRYHHSVGLLIFDLDHFKSYNDRYGHAAGNEALRAVSTTIRNGLRQSDFSARYGGEEFAAILVETDAEGMWQTAERIRLAIEALPPIDGRDTLTSSIGGALFPQDGATSEELFGAADRRLYEAKDAGRNRTVAPRPPRATSAATPA